MRKANFENFDQKSKRVLTIDEYCYRYGVGRSLACKLIRDGKLRSFKIGHRRLIAVEAAERLLAEAAG